MTSSPSETGSWPDIAEGMLQRAGYRVLRIAAALVTSNIEAAVAVFRDALGP